MVKQAQVRSTTKRARAPKTPTLRKYTNLAAAIHLLQTQHITLLDPALWDDKNDAWFMKEYQDIIGATSVLAICFAEANETYHHWKVFSPGVDGVCLELDKAAILSAFEGAEGIRQGPVKYALLDALRRRDSIDAEELPFLKRQPYRPESEFRVVYVDKGSEKLLEKSFPIEIAWIKRITLSPWMHLSLRDSVIKTLRAIPGCSTIKIARSTLVGNREWQALTRRARQ